MPFNSRRTRAGSRLRIGGRRNRLEPLETRCLLAVDGAIFAEALPFRDDSESGQPRLESAVAELSLTLVDLDGQPGLVTGEPFEIEVHFRDLNEARALFSGYGDLEFDPGVLRIDHIRFDSDYPFGRTGTIDPVQGKVEEVGATAGLELPAGTRVFTLEVTAIGAGTTLVTSHAGEAPVSEVVLWGSDEDNREQTDFGALELEIEAATFVSFELAEDTAHENGGPHDVYVVLATGGPDLLQDVTVDVSDLNLGTALSGSDYGAFPGQTLTFVAGSPDQSRLKVSLELLDDFLIEGLETLVLGLANVTGPALVGSNNNHTLVIEDNDQAVLSFDLEGSHAVEADASHDIAVRLDTGGATLAVPVTVDIGDLLTGTAVASDDYSPLTTTTITFTAGSPNGSKQTIRLDLLDDLLAEGDESVVLELLEVTGPGIIGTPSHHTLTIQDDEAGLEQLSFHFRLESTRGGRIVGSTSPNLSEANLHEWETARAELWVTLGEYLPLKPFDLTTEIASSLSDYEAAVLHSHLGNSASVQNQSTEEEGIATVNIDGLDLTDYDPGQQVLVAVLTYRPNPENPKGLAAFQEGAYPEPADADFHVLSAETDAFPTGLQMESVVSGQFAPVIYDSTEDGRVSLHDFLDFVQSFGKRVTDSPEAYLQDYDRSGSVGLSDFLYFVQHFGVTKPTNAAISMPYLTSQNQSQARGYLTLEPEPTVAALVGSQLLSAGEFSNSQSVIPVPNGTPLLWPAVLPRNVTTQVSSNEPSQSGNPPAVAQKEDLAPVLNELDARVIDALFQQPVERLTIHLGPTWGDDSDDDKFTLHL